MSVNGLREESEPFMSALLDAPETVTAGLDTDGPLWSLLDWYGRSSASQRQSGADWYPAAARFAESLGDLERVAAVIAACSPRLMWAPNGTDRGNNLDAARAVMAGEPYPRMLPRFYADAVRCRDAADPLAVLTGPKRQAFAANIVGDWERVTVDVWAVRALGPIDLPRTIRANVYGRLEAIYRTAADLVRVPPAVLQATVWVTIRGGN